MLFMVLIAVVLLLPLLIPVGVSLSTGGRSRRYSDSLIVGLFAGLSSVGLISIWIGATAFFIPEVMATGVGWWTTFSLVVAAPVAMTWLTHGWLRSRP